MPRSLKFTIVTALFGLSAYLIIITALSIYSVFGDVKSLKSLTVSVRDLFNILFYAVVSAISILSYLSAKKTLFTPIKTEIFKMQIGVFQEILAAFQNRTNIDFSEQFDFFHILSGNALLMMNEYIRDSFKDQVNIDEKAIKENFRDFVGAVASEDYLASRFFVPEGPSLMDRDEESEADIGVGGQRNWSEYKCGNVRFTKKYAVESKKIEHLIASPLLPVELRQKLEAFHQAVLSNLFLTMKILTDVGRTLPDKFTDLESTRDYSPLGIWTLFNSESESLETHAHEIAAFVRDYLRIEELMQ